MEGEACADPGARTPIGASGNLKPFTPIVHKVDNWSGRALPSPGEGNRGEGGGHREGKA